MTTAEGGTKLKEMGCLFADVSDCRGAKYLDGGSSQKEKRMMTDDDEKKKN